MKNAIISIASAFMFVLFLFQGQVSAQACTKTFVNRSGTVYAAGPAIETLKAKANALTIKVAKQDGKAQTIVNIYVNGQRKKYLTFNNGKYTATKTATITGVMNKTVKIEIVNQSVGNKFKYNLKVTGETPANLGSANGTLVGQTKKTLMFDRVCTSKNKMKITVRRTSGQARATIIIKKNGRQIDSKVLNNNQSIINLSYSNAGGARYTIELKNVSVGNTIGYDIKGIQAN
jgi:PKD repeat protein